MPDDNFEMQVIKAAIEARQKAYAPYSNFRVGAAIVDENGHIHSGVNVENAAYPQGTCAEAGAIAAMIISGARHIKMIAVSGKGPELCTPCGGCRQKIREFALPDAEILICDEHTIRQKFSLESILPYSFGPNNL